MGELIVNGIKLAFIIMVAGVFLSAILNFVTLLGTIALGGTVVGEVLGLVSMYLPFDASAVIGALGTATEAILAFLVARKIYALTSSKVSA